jgi:hypothetical protein
MVILEMFIRHPCAVFWTGLASMATGARAKVRAKHALLALNWYSAVPRLTP